MKICIECGRQLFDHDKFCDKCNSENIIFEKEYNKMLEEIQHANIFRKKKLLKNHDYNCIYNRLQQPEVSYPKPLILKNSTGECDEDYWRRIDQHTIIEENLTSPKVECPYCHSTNTKKISGISKAGSVALFGVFAAGKVSKQWHCNNCSSDF